MKGPKINPGTASKKGEINNVKKAYSNFIHQTSLIQTKTQTTPIIAGIIIINGPTNKTPNSNDEEKRKRIKAKINWITHKIP